MFQTTTAKIHELKIGVELQHKIKAYLKRNTKKVKVPDFELKDSDFYLKNPTVKRSNVMHEYSDLQIAEWFKCSKDPIYFIEKYVKIISLDEGMVPFVLYQYQRKMIKMFQSNRFSLAVTARQMGKTATVAAFLLWYSLFHQEKLIAVLANKAAQSREIISRITTSLESTPFFLQAGQKVLNKGTLEFNNGSRIIGAATSSSSIRGLAVNMLYLDEFAFVQNDYEFYESTYPVVTAGKTSRVLITSTPNGAKGLFHKFYKESLDGRNMFSSINVPWHEHPERDEEWAKITKAGLAGEGQWLQEFCCHFAGSAGSLIAMSVLETMVFKNPVKYNDSISIYYEPEEEKQYVITVDTARGLGQDYSAFVVFDVSNKNYKVVAKYRSNDVSPLIFPSMVHHASVMYNNAYVLVESNDIGEQTANILHFELENESLFRTVTLGRSGQTIDGSFSPNSRLGAKTTTPTKNIGCSTLKTLVENNMLEVNDNDIILELGTFVTNGKSYEADKGCNDDLAMCLVMFSWLTTQQYFKDMTDINSRQDLVDQRENQIYEMLTPFGFISTNEDEYDTSEEGGWEYATDDDERWLMG